MKLCKLFASLLVFSVLHLNQPAQAADNPADAIAMVEKGLAYMQKNGKDALAQEINNKNPEFINGSIYLYLRNLDGTVIAHPVNSKLVGKNLIDLPDADGKYFRKDILALAKSKGKGWVDYRYNNPVSKQIENKSTYVFRSNDVILEAGIYKGN